MSYLQEETERLIDTCSAAVAQDPIEYSEGIIGNCRWKIVLMGGSKVQPQLCVASNTEFPGWDKRAYLRLELSLLFYEDFEAFEDTIVSLVGLYEPEARNVRYTGT